MNRNDSEAVLSLHRTFRPHRRTGRGFLTGTVFLDAALLFTAFVLATSPFVQKPGIVLNLPEASQVDGIRFNDMVLSITRTGLFFFNDELLNPADLGPVLSTALQKNPDAALILEADRLTPQSTVITIYDAAILAGFHRVFIATQNAESVSP
ncbi:MAG: biopolymer transport protein ExbD [Verrucomicrobiota bacterium]|jgi:biopolymer transport protein ExbD|nr:biopolymer transport protein ExbD [Verrucomicrobiota bacterium]MDK2963243.1 biopolymer transport protein ExbD [Verrucomicrobiota bacterium]